MSNVPTTRTEVYARVGKTPWKLSQKLDLAQLHPNAKIQTIRVSRNYPLPDLLDGLLHVEMPGDGEVMKFSLYAVNSDTTDWILTLISQPDDSPAYSQSHQPNQPQFL